MLPTLELEKTKLTKEFKNGNDSDNEVERTISFNSTNKESFQEKSVDYVNKSAKYINLDISDVYIKKDIN